jgi:uncharacterized damage-inducible protein DinB
MATDSAQLQSILENLLLVEADKLGQLCERAAACVRKLTPEQIWMRNSENENAVGNLVLHITGNIRQWLLTGVGNQTHPRNRDAEFAVRGADPARPDPEEMLAQLQVAAGEAVALIRALPAERLAERATGLRNPVTVLEAILHVVEHTSGHTGQIVYATKFLTGEDLGFSAQMRAARARQI